MKKLKIIMLGAGSGFVVTVAKELKKHEIFADSSFYLIDPAPDRLNAAKSCCEKVLADSPHPIHLHFQTQRGEVFRDCDYVISACEKNRYVNWAHDLRIPEKYGVFQVKGENGGPGGLIHGLRNIALFQEILRDMEELCPDAWLMNFTNPMSILCTYFKNHSRIRSLGFCHQVHGSFGLIAELLGFAPGELEVIAGGINHLNWLFDIRRRGTGTSYLRDFLSAVRKSEYWQRHHASIPAQRFTLEVLNTFGMYPVGYDDHIIEYLPFFWKPEHWEEYGIHSLAATYERMAQKKEKTLEMTGLLGKEYVKPPFPVDPEDPYYAEKPCQAIFALETNTPVYFDAINIRNNGAIDNLPSDAIVDVPALAIGGEVRSVHVGALPPGPAEICRRQSALHELIVQGAHEGDERLILQALCLDPYVQDIECARKIWNEFKGLYYDDLPKFGVKP